MTDSPAPAAELPFRILPALTDLNREFWTAGTRGELRFLRCNACGYYNHPPTAVCPVCHSKDLAPSTVSGKATLHTYTINHQAWMPAHIWPAVAFHRDIGPQSRGQMLQSPLSLARED